MAKTTKTIITKKETRKGVTESTKTKESTTLGKVVKTGAIIAGGVAILALLSENKKSN